MGNEVTQQSEKSWTRDIIRFNCGGWEFKFRQHPNIAHGEVGSIKGNFSNTSTVEIQNVTFNKLKKVLEILDAIYWLLSFATESQVVRYGYKFLNCSESGHFRSVAGVANYFRPLFNNTIMIKSFVEQSYPVYQALSNKRKLPVFFNYLVQAGLTSQPTEIRLVLLFVALENLKDTFARNAGFQYKKSYYRKAPIKPGKLGAKYSFEKLLLLMLRSVGMRRGLKQIITLRNDIIHSGLSKKPHSRQLRIYERIQDIIRKYILRLLDYCGEFCTHSNSQ